LVYIKRVKLSHFKSFGGTADVPLLPGFTVVTGPNGSGKSNILDGCLFALGLSSSKGMRADRLPDLVNQSYSNRSRATVEASVTVTFCLKDWEPEDLVQQASEAELEAQAEVAAAEAVGEERLDLPELVGSAEAPPRPRGVPSTALMAAFPQLAEREQVEEVVDEALQLIQVKPGLEEWSVMRRLRVTPQGTYTSSYSINGQACTLTQLHEQLRRLRIYPEGYNIVLQGDVTGIISMHGRERREIIDELAGVAQFDRKIVQAKGKLDAVKEREDRCRIVELELEEQLNRLAKDRVKAEKYKRLRQELQDKQKWEAVLIWEDGKKAASKLTAAITAGDRQKIQLGEQITALTETIGGTSKTLDELNQRVKALGEAELLALQSKIATQQAEERQIGRQLATLETESQKANEQIATLGQEQQQQQNEFNALEQTDIPKQRRTIASLTQLRDRAQAELTTSRESANAIATESQAWVQQQQQLRQQMDSLVQSLDPQRAEQAQQAERSAQLSRLVQQQQQELEALEKELAEQQQKVGTGSGERDRLAEQVGVAASAVASTEQEYRLQQETQQRLLREQREKQRQLDKLESMRQAIQETQGTQASRIIMDAGLDGICGIVAELGQVEKRYRTALDTAAGGRLGQIVVESDRVAAAGIDLLKRKRGGRATFLPLNKIRPGRMADVAKWDTPVGFVDNAVNLVSFDQRYEDVFRFIFNNTAVFEDISSGRRSMGRYRIVTLDGDLLEASGAMTGGSRRRGGGGLSFGAGEAAEPEEVRNLRDRLVEIETILRRCEKDGHHLSAMLRQRTQTLSDLRDAYRTEQLQSEQTGTLVQRTTQQRDQLKASLERNQAEIKEASTRLESLKVDLPGKDEELQRLRQQLAELEKSPLHNEWQQRQGVVQRAETHLQEQDQSLRTAEQILRELEANQERLGERLAQNQQQIAGLRSRQTEQINQQTALKAQQETLLNQIKTFQAELAVIEQKLGSEKVERDRTERLLREQQSQKQQWSWQLQKTQETQQEQRTQLADLEETLAEQEAELPEPLPEIPDETRLEGVGALQHYLRNLAKRIQAMEPVNMLALEEYERTQERLEELKTKLATLESERTELLLRIETFTTLRQRAFMESFNAVNENFKEIFETLSDGEGFLQLDNPESPLDGGLNLVAHPKGKAVRRLASMSGGEKSLTALSFIFALQRYRPSPFYSFDEVDSFLDGANVERLAKIIRKQCDEAQFIVVSHRRPMIEMAQRTIGVTQARGAHTQVLGISQEQAAKEVEKKTEAERKAAKSAG